MLPTCRGCTISFESTVFLQVDGNSSYECDNLFVSTYIPQWNLLVLISPFQLGSVKLLGNHSRLRSQVLCIDTCEEDLNRCSVHRNKPARYLDGNYTCQLVRIRKLWEQMHRN